MKNLVYKFRWLLIIVFIIGLISLLTAALVENGNTFATVGIIFILASFAAASCLELIDEQTPER